MSKGERPRAPGQSLQKPVALRLGEAVDHLAQPVTCSPRAPMGAANDIHNIRLTSSFVTGAACQGGSLDFPKHNPLVGSAPSSQSLKKPARIMNSRASELK